VEGMGVVREGMEVEVLFDDGVWYTFSHLHCDMTHSYVCHDSFICVT